MSMYANAGRVGRPRGIGLGILLFVVTLGFYGWYWVFKTQDEIKQHTGQGLGGVLGLVVWILISAVSAFVIPSEVGKMYSQDGRAAPITGAGPGLPRSTCPRGRRGLRGQGPAGRPVAAATRSALMGLPFLFRDGGGSGMESSAG